MPSYTTAAILLIMPCPLYLFFLHDRASPSKVLWVFNRTGPVSYFTLTQLHVIFTAEQEDLAERLLQAKGGTSGDKNQHRYKQRNKQHNINIQHSLSQLPLGKLCHEPPLLLPIQHQAFLSLTKQGLLSNPAQRGDPLQHSAFKLPLLWQISAQAVLCWANMQPGNVAGSSWQEWRVLGASAVSLPSVTSTSHRAGKLCFPLWPSSSPSIFSDSPSHPFSSSKTQFFHSRCLHRFWLHQKHNAFNFVWMVFPKQRPVEVTAPQAASMWLLNTWLWPASLDPSAVSPQLSGKSNWTHCCVQGRLRSPPLGHLSQPSSCPDPGVIKHWKVTKHFYSTVMIATGKLSRFSQSQPILRQWFN